MIASGDETNIYVDDILISADEHAQTSRPEHGDHRHSLGPPGPRRRRSSTPGCPSWTRSHPPPASVFPEGAARKVSAPGRRAHIPDTYAASGPEPGTCKDPDPGDGAAGDQGAQNRPVCLAMAATRTPAACPVSTTSRRYGLRRTCRLVTGRSHRPRSTWPEPGPASAPRGHAPP